MIEELETVKLIENIFFPGYFKIPKHDHLIINKNGHVINILTKRKITSHEGTHGYLNVTTSRKCYKQHRLLALTFIGRPKRHWDKSFDDLEVNHIDGIKTNNELSNLEWVTPKENIEHAIKNDLYKFKKVLVKNLNTNEIKIINSSDECSRIFNIPRSTLFDHLNSDIAGTISKNNNVFKYLNTSEWPNSDKNNISIFKTKSVKILAKNILTDKIISFDTLSKCSEYFNINFKILSRYLLNGNIIKYHKNGYVFKYDDDKPWIDIYYHNLREIDKTLKTIIITDIITKNINIFDNYKDVLKNIKIPRRLLSREFKNKKEFNYNNFHFKIL